METNEKQADYAELTEARAEAANLRVLLRDAEAQLAAIPVWHEEMKALRQTNAALQRSVLTREIADTFRLPALLAKRLEGNTREELEADARAVVGALGLHHDAEVWTE